MSCYHTYSNTRIRWFWITSLISFIAFACVAIFVMSEKVVWFDISLIELVRAFEEPAVTEVAKGFTYIGSKGPIIVICLAVSVVLFFVLRLRRELLLFLAVGLGSEILNMLLKNLFRRIRPDINRLVEVTGYSFPSGHSMAAFSLYGILTYLMWKHLRTAVRRIIVLTLFSVMILFIGLSRIYLGVHYPSDVIGGYLASCSWLMLSIGVYEAQRDRDCITLQRSG